MSRACDVRIACPLNGLATHTLRSRQSNSPTCGYLPLNLSVQNFALTCGPTGSDGLPSGFAAGLSEFVASPAALAGSRLRKPNIRRPSRQVDRVVAGGRGTGGGAVGMHSKA